MMATKMGFTAAEWETLQWAVTDTMSYVSMADPGFWDTFKEATAAAKFMAQVKTTEADVLVRELAGDVKIHRDKAVTAADMAGAVCTRVSEAARLVAEKAPEDLDSYKRFILGVAQVTAEAAKGVDAAETVAIEHIKDALG
jgi:hypothetical protein